MSDDALPEGWTPVDPLEIAVLVRGVSYAKGEAVSEPGPGRVALLRANNIDGELKFCDLQYVPRERVSAEQNLRAGDVVIAMSSGSKAVVGKAASLRNQWDGTFGAFCGVLRPHPVLDARYFGLFFQTQQYRTTISELSAGTNINNLKRQHFEQLVLPVAPIAEQRRIVAKVEALLSEVDAARERLARLPAILRRFRQSVLAAACSGRLTEDWRRRHPEIQPAVHILKRVSGSRTEARSDPAMNPVGEGAAPSGWARTTIRTLAEPTLRGRPYVTSGSRGWARYESREGAYFVRSENINSEELRLDEAIHVNAPPGAEAERTRIHPGDLLLTITGNNVGRVAVVPARCPAAYVSQHVAIIRTTTLSRVNFLWLWLRSIEHGQRQLRSHFYGYTKPGLNLDQVMSVEVNLPPLEEQDEMLRCVATVFRMADSIERQVRVALACVDRVTESILAKAFRGELVPTEAELARREGRDYESASALLDRIRRGRGGVANRESPTRTRRPSRFCKDDTAHRK